MSNKKGDISWIASYPKSGNTWMRVMIASYLSDSALGSRDELDNYVPSIGELMDRGKMLPVNTPGPQIVKTHFLPAADVLRPYEDVTNKVVYIVRNPRDVIHSATRTLSISPEFAGDFAKDFIEHRGVSIWVDGWGTWPDHVRDWTIPDRLRRHFPRAEVITVRYEDMRSDPAASLLRTLEFLDVAGPVDRQCVDKAVQNSSLERMRMIEDADRRRGLWRFRKPPTGRVVGQGLRNQSLEGFGADVAAAYEQLMREDAAFLGCLQRFGYEQ
jgi:Sulfotransferase domain